MKTWDNPKYIATKGVCIDATMRAWYQSVPNEIKLTACFYRGFDAYSALIDTVVVVYRIVRVGVSPC